MIIRAVETEFFHANKRTDKHKETSNLFTKFCERHYEHQLTFDKLRESSLSKV